MSRVMRNKTLVNHLIKTGVIKNQRDLGEKLGYTNESAFSQVINQKVAEPKDFIAKLKTIMPELNVEWLVSGEGSITLPATMTIYGTAIEEVEDVSASGIDMSLIPAEKVEEIREEIKAEVIEEVKAEVVEESVVPIVPSEIASKSETNIKKYLEENADELEHFDPRSVTASVNGAERVCSNSMYPTFIPYDVVFIRFLKDKTRITDGGIYYFDSKTRPTMIRMVKIEGNKLRLVAENPRFGDIITDFDDITNIAEIKGMYREQFSGQNVEIEQERRHKDAQITTLIEQNGEALNIIKDLIKKG